MDMPTTLVVNGVEYVRKDSLKPGPASRRWMTIAQVSELTGFSPRTCYDAVASGLLKVVTPNGTTRGMRTTEAWVDEWLDGKTPRATLADGGAWRQTRVDAGANGIS